MSALEQIIKWADRLPEWESDAIRRILTQPDFTEKDIQDIIVFLKINYGLVDKDKDVSIPRGIKKGDISGAPQDKLNILLKSIKCTSGINAIPDNSILPFRSESLNAIYGDNGTGKSGYVRVLKKACRARDIEEDILSNVYDEEDKTVKAHFEININEEDRIISWENQQRNINELSNICVFDSKCARIILDKRNNIQYLPYGTFVFKKLVEVLNIIREKLELEKPIPVDLPPKN